MAYDPDKDICEGKHGGKETSIEAFEKIDKSGRRKRLQAQCHSYVRNKGTYGATSNEAENALGLPNQTATARFSELKALGLIYETKRRRNTVNGSPAMVCVDIDIGLANGIEPNDNPRKYVEQHAAIAARLRLAEKEADHV